MEIAGGDPVGRHARRNLPGNHSGSTPACRRSSSPSVKVEHSPVARTDRRTACHRFDVDAMGGRPGSGVDPLLSQGARTERQRSHALKGGDTSATALALAEIGVGAAEQLTKGELADCRRSTVRHCW